MSSSISSSEQASAWRRFALIAPILAGALLCVFLATAYAIDPYDSGRSKLFEKRGVRPQGPRIAHASRGRDPRFNAAIFGNSHIQLISPERLAGTGLSFVQLSIPATRPREQLLMMDWFARHHAAPRAMILGADAFWCTSDAALPNDKPFPFWLYTTSTLEYLTGLIRYDVLEEIPRRLNYLLARNPERAQPDGYWDNEANWIDQGYASDPRIRARLEQPPSPAVGNASGRYPAAERLRSLLDRLSPDIAFIVVFPPAYTSSIPDEGTAGAAAERACKAGLIRALSGRPRTAFVDWRVDRPENRNPEHFFDHTHYRQPIARLVEKDIADALARLAPNP